MEAHQIREWLLCEVHMKYFEILIGSKRCFIALGFTSFLEYTIKKVQENILNGGLFVDWTEVAEVVV